MLESLAWPGPQIPGAASAPPTHTHPRPTAPLRRDPRPRRAGEAAAIRIRCSEWVQPSGFGNVWPTSEKSYNGFRERPPV